MYQSPFPAQPDQRANAARARRVRACEQSKFRVRECIAILRAPAENCPVFKEGQLVRVNLAGMQVQGVMFQAAVTDAVGNIVRQTSENPPAYLVKLLFSFKGVSEVEVPADRIHAA